MPNVDMTLRARLGPFEHNEQGTHEFKRETDHYEELRDGKNNLKLICTCSSHACMRGLHWLDAHSRFTTHKSCFEQLHHTCEGLDWLLTFEQDWSIRMQRECESDPADQPDDEPLSC